MGKIQSDQSRYRKIVTYNGTVYYNKYLGLMQITLALQDNSHHGADYYIIGKFPEQLKHLIKKQYD